VPTEGRPDPSSTMAERGWAISWAIDALNSSNVVRRISSTKCARISLSASSSFLSLGTVPSLRSQCTSSTSAIADARNAVIARTVCAVRRM
jgi:hypothetical protein